jgi:hypothetical protein
MHDVVTVEPQATQAPTSQPKSWEEYATAVSLHWGRAVDAIVETGRVLLEAKDALRHGAFQAMVRTKLPFNDATARKLMAIARHHVISNRSHVSALPPSWGTLYALTKVPDGKLLAGIRDGTINPKLERKHVAALRGDQPGTANVKQPTLREQLDAANREIERLSKQGGGDIYFSKNDTAHDIAACLVTLGPKLDSVMKACRSLKKAKG